MSNRFITDGAGQEILGNLDAIQKTLAGQSASAAAPSDFTGKQFLTEETGRDIASKLASIMESLASYVAPSAKKVQNKLSISVNGELTEYDGSAEETVDLEDGLEGLGIFRSSYAASTSTTSISISTITVPEGRSLKVGDLIIANSTYSYLYRVTAVNDTTVTVTYLQSLRGATGSRGSSGTTPNISISASVSNTTGTPSVTVTEGGTTAAPSFAFAFSGLKGADGANGSDADVPSIYLHNIKLICIGDSNSATFSLQIINTSATEFNFSTLTSYIRANGFTSHTGDVYNAAGGAGDYNVCGVYSSSIGRLGVVAVNSSNSTIGMAFAGSQSTIRDNVIQII